jgi:Flp pilus assembly protein TadG
MIRNPRAASRRGSILPFLVLSVTALMGFVALAVDLGVMAIAQSQCQNAADAAATAGARTLTGDPSTNNNAANVATNAYAAAEANYILGTAITDSQVTVSIGTYTYNSATQSFPTPPFTGLTTIVKNTAPPTNATDNWSLCQVNVTYQGNILFGKVFGLTTFNTSAVSTAAHRPMDVAIILDFSGSMRFGCLPGVPAFGTRDNTGAGVSTNSGSNNPESIYPTFGPYSATATAGLQNTSNLILGGHQYGVSNLTITTSDGRPAIVKDFYTDTAGTPAFATAGNDGNYNYSATTPGDPYAFVKGSSSNFAQEVEDIVGGIAYNTNWETNGYKSIAGVTTFNGYTNGPNYWGKTFFMWPPDPLNDWRSKFFGNTTKSVTATSGPKNGSSLTLVDNTKLWRSDGTWQDPKAGNYTVNYSAILSWIKNTGTNPFPTRMQSGRIVYYTAIPDTIDTSTWPPTDLNQRFWKDYIDYVLGFVQQDSSGNYETITGYDNYWYGSNVGLEGYGGDFVWGTVQIKAPPTDSRYIDYQDNPKRPRLHFWFGPMTMVDFLGCYNLWYDVNPAGSRFNWWPGTCHESPMYACKLGIQAALDDIKNNHPNHRVSLIYYSVPQSSATDYGNRFNRVRAPLSRDPSRALDALWYPIATIENPGTTLNPYDYNNIMEIPHAMGGTCFSMPLMLAFNQFSGNSSLQTYNPSPAPTGDTGGLGRKGAQKLVVLETDGLPNTTATANFQDNGAYNSYYKVRYNSSTPSSSEFPSTAGWGDNDPNVTSEIYGICNQICALDTASPAGYSTVRKPVLIHCVGFGPVYDVGSPQRASALQTLEQIQYIGKTQPTPGYAMDLNQPYKIINGTQAQMVNQLQQAFTIIMQGGVEISLLQ